MGISPKLKEFLDQQRVEYESLEHPPAFDAQRIAAAQHISGKRVLKTLIVKADNEYVMCVLPAIHNLDFEKFKESTGAKKVRLATEAEIAALFPEYEIGAEPPFGKFKGLKVYADPSLKECDRIAFNGGTHTDMVEMSWNQYQEIEKPTLIEIGRSIA